MRSLRITFFPLFAFIFFTAWAISQETKSSDTPQNTPDQTATQTPAPPTPAAESFDEVIGRIVGREHFFNDQIRQFHPLIETYIQSLKKDDETGAVPVSDRYFLGRLDLGGSNEERFAQNRSGRSLLSKINVVPKFSELYSMRFLPGGFAQMVLLDQDFQRKYYTFTYVRREFLGEVRCLVIDVQPRKEAGDGRFLGRIWVEDQDYNLVRFNGTYSSRSHQSDYLHFDSWRLNMRVGQWLPAYVYSEESGGPGGHNRGEALHFKAQTRLWGYDLQKMSHNEAFTEIMVDSPQSVHDQSDASQDATPVESERLWEREAEDNAIERLQKAGLVSPPGEVDQVMQTVVNNLIFTNNLNIQPEVRARVLLTTPIESFTIGHTIVLSRGLLDVLPDEASLAMILAHELAHIDLGHHLDTKMAFNDRFFFPDRQTFERLDFRHDPAEEEAADNKAVELLANSPYKDKLASAGLFLRNLQQNASVLKSLIRPHLGSSMANGESIRMSQVLSTAPPLAIRKTDQVAALPLGARIRLDPWSSRVELVKTKPVALTTFREKMPFEITPFFPYLSKFSSAGADRVALTAPVK
jgi:Peptidase family M48